MTILKAAELAVIIIGWVFAGKWELEHKRSIPAMLGLAVTAWVVVWIIVK